MNYPGCCLWFGFDWCTMGARCHQRCSVSSCLGLTTPWKMWHNRPTRLFKCHFFQKINAQPLPSNVKPCCIFFRSSNSGWQELGNDADRQRILGIMVEAVMHAKGKIPDNSSYWPVYFWHGHIWHNGCMSIHIYIYIITLCFFFGAHTLHAMTFMPGRSTSLSWMRAGSPVMIWVRHLEASHVIDFSIFANEEV